MEKQDNKRGFSGMQVFAIAAACIVLTCTALFFFFFTVFSPAPFSPVNLTPGEKLRLEKKLDRLEHDRPGQYSRTISPDNNQGVGAPVPEAYSEGQAARTVTFTEREINSLLAHNTNLAQRVAIDLSRDLISIKMLVPVEPDFPILGGKILRLKAGAELRYQERPVLIFRGVSIMGVPIPKAWLGGMKNVDLIGEFGTEQGFWKSFSDGVESLQVLDGEMQITLRE